MQRLFRCLWLVTAFTLASAGLRADDGAPEGGSPTDIPVDLQLILAVDSSGSIDTSEFRLQMDGFAAAFRNPSILEAVRRGPRGAIAVTLVEWSSINQQHQSIGWTKLCDDESVHTFADQIASSPRFVIGGSTSVSDALRYAAGLFAGSGFSSERRVIDVSGDGSNNSGLPPENIRDAVIATGITINGLAILTDEPGLAAYYQNSVIGGTGAFVMVAETFQTFSNAILSKLIQEIVALPDDRRFAGAGP
jgi:hypothetical protein